VVLRGITWRFSEVSHTTMPFNSVIDTERRLIVSTGTDVVTGDEGLACCRQLKNRPDFNPAFNQLLDLTSATRFDATQDQLRRIANESLLSPGSRRAVVATNPTIFGLARMFQSYRSLSQVSENVMVFNRLDQAVAWLNGVSEDECTGD
jgi:hypothetical protein